MDTTFNDLLQTLYRTSRSCTAADFVPRALERTQTLIAFDSALVPRPHLRAPALRTGLRPSQ